MDASNNVLSYSCYEAYGTEYSSSTPTDPFGYNAQSGYYLDRETGLYLCTNRYYDPAKGRWLNRDPIGYTGGMNLYGYCGQRPVGTTDESGCQSTPFEAGFLHSIGSKDNGSSFWIGLDQAAQEHDFPGVLGGEYHAIHGMMTSDPVEALLGIGSVCMEVGLAALGGESEAGFAAEAMAEEGPIARGGVYLATDVETGMPSYVGRGKDIPRRVSQQARSFGEGYGFSDLIRTDDYILQRAWEQVYYERYLPYGTLKNKIRPVAADNIIMEIVRELQKK